jgi:hypothetical protein
MNIKEEIILSKYMALYPHSLSRVAIPFGSDEAMKPIIVLMEKAIKDKKPLTDAIFGFPDGVDY